MNPAAQQLVRQEILQRLNEYCWGYDNNDMALMGSVFSDDASSGGTVSDASVSWGPWQGRGAIVEALAAIRTSQPDRRRHVIDNWLLDSLDGDLAEMRVYVTIYSYGNGRDPHLVTTGEYSLGAIRQADGWRIRRLDEVLDSPF